jgi:hypothetical protein
VALAPFAGMGLARTMREGWRWLVLGVVLLQVLACALLLSLMLTAGQTLWPASWGLGTQVSGPGSGVGMQANPFADLHGWEAAGQRARALARQTHLDSVAVQNWTLASRLGWHARPLPVHVLEDRFDQFDLWAGDLPVGGSTLLVDWSQMAYTVPIGPHGFAGCHLLETQEVIRFGAHIASFRFYACQGWSGKPQPQLATVLTSLPSEPLLLPLPLPAPPLLP